jgi:antibiotic biosynthesis monooxygenase (ABM) superfamily enzyme
VLDDPSFSNSGKGECFLSSPKLPDWLQGPSSRLVSLFCPVSSWIKRPEREPYNLSVWSAEVLILSSQFPLVLLFQLNEQQHLKAVRVSGTDM